MRSSNLAARSLAVKCLCLLASISQVAASGPPSSYGSSLAPTYESELLSAPHCVLTIKQVNSSSSYAPAGAHSSSYLTDYVSR